MRTQLEAGLKGRGSSENPEKGRTRGEMKRSPEVRLVATEQGR